MVYRPVPNRVKKLKSHNEDFERLRNAVAAYNASKSAGLTPSVRAIAKQFGVDRTTLGRELNGEGSRMVGFNSTKQKLTPEEEKKLVQLILESADCGFPLRHREIMQFANAILQSRLGPNYEPVSEKWIYRFLHRHRDQLQTHWSKPLDTQRARSLNPEAVKSWFDLVEQHLVNSGASPENIYGMDESGFPTAYTGKERVVGARGTRVQHKQGGADRENVTAVVTICADGTTVRPLLIFKGKNMKEAWTRGNDIDAYLACTERGWTDGDIGCQWIKTVFEPATREKANGKTRFLLLDGHSSHYTIPFIECAREHNIILLGYPAHCTHALQGLDVVCFARMKENWKREIVQYEDEHLTAVDKADFTVLFSRAYTASFTPDMVKAAFRVTGVHPFSRDVVTPDQMKPSLTTSTKGSFPMPQPSPVRAVMAAMSKNPPTAFTTSPSTHTRISAPQSTTPPSTPSLRRHLELDADPALFTPSKRMRTLYATLSSTSSGSILVSNSKLTSDTTVTPPVLEDTRHFPQPDWSLSRKISEGWKTRENLEQENLELRTHLHRAEILHKAQEGVIEGSHATMVIQDLHLRKLNAALHSKEKQRAPNRTLIIDSSKAQCFSSDDILNGLRGQEARKEEEAAAKKARADARAAKREAVAKLEVEWKKIKAQHEENKEKWKLTCEKLRSEGIPKKNLPKAPTCPRKPKLPNHFTAVVDDDEEEEEESDKD